MSMIERRIADKYKSRGYEVLIEPNSTQMPFQIPGYRPDLIATRGDEKLIIEVKRNFASLPLERFQEISRNISEHPGWKFVIVNLSEEDSFTPDSDSGESWRQLLVDAAAVARSDFPSYAMIPIWNAYEAFLRSRASTAPEYKSAASLLNYLVSLGEISNDEFEAARRLSQLRNEVVHGMGSQLSRAEILSALETATSLIQGEV